MSTKDLYLELEGDGGVEVSRFDLLRNRAGFFLAPFAFFVIWLMPMPSLKPEAHSLAAIIAAVVVMWICESLPMPATALIGAALCIFLQVADAKTVLAPFADPLIFLFIGSFILARAIFLHDHDRHADHHPFEKRDFVPE